MIERRTLPNGVRMLFERMDGVRSVSVGIWVMNGSRNEPAELNGISHFIEHMVFKGTDTRTAAQIAEAMDTIGGQVNAFTTKECTCYYARVLDTHLRQVAEVLGDMVFASKFAPEDVETERGVILEEIGMYNDSPEDMASERLSSGVFAKTPLAMPILGTKKSLANINGDVMRDYLRENYVASGLLIALSGNFSDGDIDFIASLFASVPSDERRQSAPGKYRPAVSAKKKTTEQNHILLGFEGPCLSDPSRYSFSIMSNILGGGMSSRLFQKIREERGLCYSIYTFLSAHSDTGIFGVYTAVGKDSESDAINLTMAEIQRFLQHGVTDAELERSREQCKSNILLSLESTSSRMNRLARGELFTGGVTTPDEVAAAYDAVTKESVLESARRAMDFKNASLSAVGKVGTAEQYREMLARFMS